MPDRSHSSVCQDALRLALSPSALVRAYIAVAEVDPLFHVKRIKKSEVLGPRPAMIAL
jgi:hypothetical protein